MANKEPKSPEELIKLINASKEDKVVQAEAGTVFAPELNIEVAPPRSEVDVNGFLTPMARDVLAVTGNRDAADRVDALLYLLGNEEHEFDTRAKGVKTPVIPQGLYDRLKAAAQCAGLEDESLYLRQHLWYLLEKEEASVDGAEEQRRPQDDDAADPDNVRIATYLGPSNLGRIRQLAKSAGVSNRAAFKAIVLNFLKAQRTL